MTLRLALLVGMAALLMIVSGCNPYPVKKENLLEKGPMVLEYEFRNSYPMQVILDTTQGDFRKDVRNRVAAYLTDAGASSYADAVIEGSQFNVSHSIVYPLYAQEAVELLGKTVVAALKDDIHAVLYKDGFRDAVSYSIDPPVATVVNSRFSNFTQGDGTIELLIRSRVTGKGATESYDSTARILVDYLLAVDYAKLRATIQRMGYEINGAASGKAILINDAALLRAVGSAKLTVDEGVSDIERELRQRYEQAVEKSAGEIVKGLRDRKTTGGKRQ